MRIDDVAALARVSIKTVSRVVNNEPNVAARTRERVLRAVRKLNYRPNPSARGLAGNRSYLVALLYDNPSSSYVTSIQSGVLSACHAAGYRLLINPCNAANPQLAASIIGIVRQSRVDGVILTPPLSDMTSVIEALDAHGTPLVRVTPADRCDEYRSVCTNDREACRQMTEYLLSLGHERIAFILGHPSHAAVALRYLGYLDAFAARRPPPKKMIVQGFNSFESGVEAARQLLRGGGRPTAIFASNDDMAAGVLTVAHEMGLDVPRELSVAGFDDSPLARQVWPALTTVHQPIQQMAQSAAGLLLGRLQATSTGNGASHLNESRLVLRETTGIVPRRIRRGRTDRPNAGRASRISAA